MRKKDKNQPMKELNQITKELGLESIIKELDNHIQELDIIKNKIITLSMKKLIPEFSNCFHRICDEINESYWIFYFKADHTMDDILDILKRLTRLEINIVESKDILVNVRFSKAPDRRKESSVMKFYTDDKKHVATYTNNNELKVWDNQIKWKE